MKRRGARLVMGSALGLAAIGVAIDHTRHRLPEPRPAAEQPGPGQYGGQAAPCGLGGEAPCGLGESPCSLENINPCGL